MRNTLKKPLYSYFILFIITTIIGGLLLYLPITGKKSTSFIDALFTASSAFTVTGLTTVDVSSQFNILGQWVILILIQIGGLGIITVTLLTLIIINRKLSLRQRDLLVVSWNVDRPGNVGKILLQMLTYAFTIEAIGALCLTMTFVPKYGLAKGTFLSIFTSVSAFNNAGFALFKNNLMDYAYDPIVTIVVPLLIILGGVGHFVILDLLTCRRLKKMSLHSKIVLSTTLSLIVIGTVLFYVAEAHHALKHEPITHALGLSFFQSVTTRTAGFNTIDITNLTTPTHITLMVLMFIGGAPLSAAGGIKVTSLILTLVFIHTVIKGSDHPSLFRRSITPSTVQKATVISLLSSVWILMLAVAVSIFNAHTSFLTILFEVISAAGTVGLSMDFTTTYGTATKLIIILAMLIGKIGILIFAQLFIREQKDLYYYPKGNVYL